MVGFGRRSWPFEPGLTGEVRSGDLYFSSDELFRLVRRDEPIPKLNLSGHGRGNLRVVGDHNDGGPLTVEVSKQLDDPDGCLGVEVSGGFVGEDDRRSTQAKLMDLDEMIGAVQTFSNRS